MTSQLNLFDFTSPIPVVASKVAPVIHEAPLTAWQKTMAIPVMVLAACAAGLYDGKRPATPAGDFLPHSAAALVTQAYGEGLVWRYGDDEDGFTPLGAITAEHNDHYQTSSGRGRTGGAE